MNTLAKTFGIFAAISLLVNGCAALPGRSGQGEARLPKAAVYEALLGKPLSDETVIDFITANNCFSADQFLLCHTAGMALWTDSNQVETIYLYLNHADGFDPYEGQLPFGLKFYDNLAAVEYKLNRQGIGNAGLPDITATPDHIHYRATYYQAGLTILYNSPFADEDASIYAILIDRQNARAKDSP